MSSLDNVGEVNASSNDQTKAPAKKGKGSSKLNLVGRFFTPTRILGLLLLAALLLLRYQDPLLIQTIRLQGFDVMHRLKPREFTPLPVAVVDLDEASLRKFGQWPWPRTRIADLIDGLAQRGAVVTGFDIIFSEADRLSPAKIAEDNRNMEEDLREKLRSLPDNEVALAKAMQKHRVVSGQTSVRNQRDVDENAPDFKDASYAAIGQDPRPFMMRFPGLVQNMPQIEAAAAGQGVFSVYPDPDGIYRKVPLVMLLRDKVRLALSAELIRVGTGGDSFGIKANAAGMEGIIVGRNLVATDRNGRVWPYFTPSRPERYISAGSILDGSVNPARIGGHLVLIGTSAVGLEDYRATPLGVPMPGVEIHAQVIENILTKQFLNRPATSKLVELLAALLAGALIIVVLPKLGAVYSFAMAAVTMGAFTGASWWYFSTQRYLLDPTFPLIATASLFIFMATANYIREERQRGQIRNAFGQYLSPALVDQLGDDPDKLVLGGETRELSLLFTDVRGFTTISESYKDNPQGLTLLMNRFLTVLSQPILDFNGTIDKYMGDAIMAFWNAPVEDQSHAKHACLAALKMIENVDALNASRDAELKNSETETYHAINVGIGINTGACVVGNMGSENRFDYTALGDTVNLASRLEGQSKPYGVPIVIGAETADQVSDTFATYEIDLIRVKGKNEPVKIYALAGDEEFAEKDDFKSFRALNATMLAAYRNQDWTSAFEALELIDGLGEKLKLTLSEYVFIYETRIAEFRANPPGPNWDGVYTATSK